MKLLNGVVLTVGVILLYPPLAWAQNVNFDANPWNRVEIDARAVLDESNTGPPLPPRLDFVPYEGPDWSLHSVDEPGLSAPAVQEEDEWPGWVRPAVFIGGGALVGAAWGTYAMVTAEDGWMSWPAHVVTVPIGMAAGAALAFFFS